MDGRRPAAVGKTLGWREGFPHLSASAIAYSLRRTALTVVAVAAFVTALSATSAAIEGHADAGLVFDAEAKTVLAVSPTGFAWRAGVRPGQRIVSVGRAEDPGGWYIETIGAERPTTAREGPTEEALRASLPFAVLAVVASALAVFLLRTNRDWVLPAASLSLLGSSVPLFLANSNNTGLTLALAAAVPAGGAIWRVRRWRAVAVGAGVGATVALGLWWASWSAGAAGAEALEQLRRAVAVGSTGLLVVDRAVVGTGPAGLMASRWRLFGDLAAVFVVGGALVLLYLAAFPAPVIAVVMILGLLAALPLRVYLGRRLEYALTADLRAQLTADVAEEERARLARELHDVPLQHLSAVIRRLELVPGTKVETGSLLEIADELRAVAIELHPPMLDDLGLGAALDFLAERSGTKDLPVEAHLEDTTAPYRRPPSDVELAVYRIAHEAVTNAIKHAEAHRVDITASIGPQAIELEITDDGLGLSDDVIRRASGRGRIGLSSMRRRARGIDADLSIGEGIRGARVRLTWRD